MKRTERRHLKENEVRVFARQARETLEARKREIIAAAIIIAIGAASGIASFAWHQRVQARAHSLLADALAVQEARVVPPAPATSSAPAPPAPGTFPTEQARSEAALQKLKAVADAYPTTDAGIFARYQEGATLTSLGRSAEAAKAYQEVISRAGEGIYGQMARLGLAESDARAGQYDRAINTFKELAQRKEGPLPIDGVLMQLGRTYLDAGKPGDAKQTFNRLVEEYPDSPFTGEARRQLEGLKKT